MDVYVQKAYLILAMIQATMKISTARSARQAVFLAQMALPLYVLTTPALSDSGKTCPDNCTSCKSQSQCMECQPGYYGSMCEKICSDGCINSICNKIDAHCSCTDGRYGQYCKKECPKNCKTCFREDKCHMCKPGHYGKLCTHQCPVGCLDDLCDKETGVCSKGCKTNFEGDKCDRCLQGKFGDNCTEVCPKNCIYCISNKNCTKCANGLFGELCDVCNSEDSRQSCVCSDGCMNNKCFQGNGTCLEGCKPNFEGDLCQNCVLGKYGVNCTHNCPSACNGSVCEKTTGNCCNEACARDGVCGKTNFEGDKCDRCPQGKFGDKCTEVCPKNCIYCNSNKNCTKCANGLFGELCDVCNSEDSRQSCVCSDGCMNNKCFQGNGTCLEGCKPNFKGDLCQNCVLGRYGVNCTHNCPSACNGSVCEKTTGNCCNEACARDGVCGVCINDTRLKGESEQNTGAVTAIVVLVVIAIPVVVFFSVRAIRRRKLMDMCFSRIEKVIPQFRMEDLHIETPAEKQMLEVEMAEPNMAFLPTRCIQLDIEESCDPEQVNLEESSAHVYLNTLEVQERRIPLDRLREYVANKTTEAMAEEFASLPKELLNTFDVSQREENVTKNRYKGIYPYDKNRVVISGGDGDYINASFIDGHKKRKSYIACLGPTKNHMDNFVLFWQMVWQENVTTIAMLTKLIELGFAKCDKYWPDNECTEQYGEISVIGQTEDIFEEYTIRTFGVKKLQDTRVIRQVHFTEWPDKGVPGSVSSVIHLQREVRRLREDCDFPLVVHCSAGIGRTGTFIALDILTDEGVSEGYVDIYACVRNLREQRVNMVQTPEQYSYLHEAVAESLLSDIATVGVN